jgi:hypothetical protein
MGYWHCDLGQQSSVSVLTPPPFPFVNVQATNAAPIHSPTSIYTSANHNTTSGFAEGLAKASCSLCNPMNTTFSTSADWSMSYSKGTSTLEGLEGHLGVQHGTCEEASFLLCMGGY